MAAALRASLLMGLMPEAGYGQILAALFGDLALLPWQVPFAVPTATVLATWRDAAGPEPVLRLQDMVLRASAAEHQEHGYRAIEIGDLRLGSVDGSVTRMPGTPANRAGFGSAGTGDDSAPYPQLRDLLVSDAATRGTLGVVTGPSGGDKPEAEQALLDRALTEYAWLFTKSRLWVLDRNFPGVARIKKMISVTHVLIRLKSHPYPRGMVAFARKSRANLHRRSRLGLSRLGCCACRTLRVCGMMARAARDAELLWDQSPFKSLALGSGPGGSLPVASSTLVRLRVHALTADPRAAR